MSEARKEREARFHDEVFTDERRSHLWSSYYAIEKVSVGFYERYLQRHCRGADVLEYGCGVHSRAFLLADHGARRVVGIDISPVAVDRQQARAADGGFEQASFEVMDAEQLSFEDDRFDLVCGTAILHHLDLDRAYPEISRVLRPGGRAIFTEPLGHNPAINLYRRRTPDLRTPDEHPLLIHEITDAHRWFGEVRIRFFHLGTFLAVPFRGFRAFEPLLGGLAAFDRALFRAVPPVRRYAWQVAVELSLPADR